MKKTAKVNVPTEMCIFVENGAVQNNCNDAKLILASFDTTNKYQVNFAFVLFDSTAAINNLH